MFMEMPTFYKHVTPDGGKVFVFYPFSINISLLRSDAERMPARLPGLRLSPYPGLMWRAPPVPKNSNNFAEKPHSSVRNGVAGRPSAL